MHFAEIIRLVLHFLLCQGANSSRYSVLEKEISSLDNVDNILGQFLADFNKAYLMKIMPRHVTIIGASSDELVQVQSIIDIFPYIICRNLETCVGQKNFAARNFFAVFLNDHDLKTLEKQYTIVPGCSDACEFLFVSKGIGIKIDDIDLFPIQTYRRGAVHSRFAHLGEDTVKLYRALINKDCRVSNKLIAVWKPGTDLSKINSFNSVDTDFNGCQISVGSFEYKPKMIIDKQKNGSLAIVGGVDGMLVLMIAEKLNFTINLKNPSKSSVEYNSIKLALREDVASGVVAFGVSRSRPNNTYGFSTFYDDECITWAVPRISGTGNLVWTEFPWIVWVLIGSVFVCSCIIRYVHHTVTSVRNANRGGVGFVTIMLDILSINLGNPVVRVPVSMGGKFILLASLYYAVVTTTAYKSSLASILTTTTGAPMVTNSKGIVKAKLRVEGSAYHYDILEDQANDSEVASELLKRYVICANESNALQRMAYNADFTLLARRSTLEYEKQMTVKGGRLIKFDILDECVLDYPTAIMLRKGSHILAPMNEVIERLRESGILQHWDHVSHAKDKTLEQQNHDAFFAILIGMKYQNIFIFYIGCILVCILVFCIEILVRRFGPKKRQPRIARRVEFMYE